MSDYSESFDLPEQSAQRLLCKRLLLITALDAYKYATGDMVYFKETGEHHATRYPEKIQRAIKNDIRRFCATQRFQYVCTVLNLAPEDVKEKLRAVLRGEGLDQMTHVLQQNGVIRNGKAKKETTIVDNDQSSQEAI